MCFFWVQFCAQFQFLKKLKHVTLETDNMKKNWPGNRAGLLTMTDRSPVLYETFISKEEDESFEISFEFE